MKKIAGKVTDIDFFSRKSTLPTCPIIEIKLFNFNMTNYTLPYEGDDQAVVRLVVARSHAHQNKMPLSDYHK